MVRATISECDGVCCGRCAPYGCTKILQGKKVTVERDTKLKTSNTENEKPTEREEFRRP